MFRDQITGELSTPGEKMFTVVLKTRKKTYWDDRGRVIGHGWEIAGAANVRESTYKKYLAFESPLEEK